MNEAEELQQWLRRNHDRLEPRIRAALWNVAEQRRRAEEWDREMFIRATVADEVSGV